jgi:hypothetical protein
MKENHKSEYVESSENLREVHYYHHNNNPWAFKIFDALNLITIGIVLLLNTTGVVGWKIWFELIRFWPLIIISAGISLIFSFSNFGKVIGKALGFLIFLLMLFLAGLNTITDSTFVDGIRANLPEFLKNPIFIFNKDENDLTQETKLLKSDYPLVENLVLNVDISKGEFNIKDISTDNDLLYLKSNHSNSDGEYTFTENLENTSDLLVDFSHNPNINNSFLLLNNSSPLYDLDISTSLKNTDLNMKLAAGKATIDLKELNLNKVITEVSAGELEATFTDLSLPEYLSIKVGAGEMDLTLPKDVGYKITYDVSIGDFSIDGKGQTSGLGSKGVLLSDNYSTIMNKTEIDLNLSVGSFKLNFK